MNNRITVTIAGHDYTLLADEDEAFTRKVAQHVNSQIQAVLEGSRLSITDAAVLAAMNISETYFREMEGAENLRRQLKEYLEESSKLKQELSEAKREIFSLKNKK